ncbi:tyrosine--tRNA ligase [archaeon SCG-AAA382B04]|nr:tyrosine--tRNA ligase [archaeon SCG-AAA382B04]
MDVQEKLSLIKRNTEEIVTKEELRDLLEKKEEPVTYVGYEPSGSLHLGHLLTANKLIDLQKAGFKVKILLADLHAYLNEKGSLEEIRKTAEMNKKCFLAYGLDKEKTDFILGSEFQLKDDYILEMYELSLKVTLNRAKRSMDEVTRRKQNPRVGQMLYPLMQTMDIGKLGIDVAVGGIDQRKIHMLARENLPSLDYKKQISIHMPILTGLDGEKMSSSKENWIDLSDTSEEVKQKIMDAYCPQGEIENNPIIEILRYHIFPRIDEFTIERKEEYGGNLSYKTVEEVEKDFSKQELHPLDLKKSVSNYLNKILEPARKKI